MNTLEKIRNGFDTMSKTERKIASWFLGHPNDFAFYTLEKAAELTGASTTSVIRFCRSMGFSGFKTFQDSLRDDIRGQKDLPFKFHETLESSSENELLSLTIKQDLHCITETFRTLSPEILRRAVRLITDAQSICTLGMKESFSLSHYAYTRLLTVRKNVRMLDTGYNGIVEPVLSLTEHDVCIVFLFHRYTKAVLSLLPLLREQGVKILMITEEPFDEVLPMADLLIPCTVNANGIKNTHAAPVCLMDYLCSAVAMENGEKTLFYMKQTEDLFNKSGMIET